MLLLVVRVFLLVFNTPTDTPNGAKEIKFHIRIDLVEKDVGGFKFSTSPPSIFV